MLVQVLPLFLLYCRSECSFSLHTCMAYQSDLNQFFSIYNEDMSFMVYYHWLHDQSFAPRTIARKLASLRSFLQFCVREGYCDSQVLLDLPYYNVPSRLPSILDQDTIDRLFSFPDLTTPKGLRDRVILELLYSTGIRVSECISLTLADVDLVEGIITILGKGDKQRRIPLTRLSHHYLSLYLSGSFNQQWVFEVSQSKPFSRFTIYSIVKRYSVMLSHETMSVSPHSFRHAFATHLLEGGARLRDVQVLLGHKQLSSSQVYTHVASSVIKDTFFQAHPRGKR